MARRTGHKIIIWDDILMMLLAVASGVFLVLELTTNPTHEQSLWYENVDLAISLIFLTEFAIKLVVAKSKTAYLKSNWWYLFASIPAYSPVVHGLEALQLLRLIRLVRLVRVTTGVPEITAYFKRYTHPIHLVGVFIFCLIVIFYGAILFYTFEHGRNAEIASVPDSIMWMTATVATIGYGETHPATMGGYVVGTVGMLAGIVAICILSAFAASVIQKRKRKPVVKS